MSCNTDGSTLPSLFTDDSGQQQKSMCKVVSELAEKKFRAFVFYKTDCKWWNAGTDRTAVQTACEEDRTFSSHATCAELDPYLPTTCGLTKPAEKQTTDCELSADMKKSLCADVENTKFVIHVYRKADCSYWSWSAADEQARTQCVENTEHSTKSCVKLDPYAMCGAQKPAQTARPATTAPTTATTTRPATIAPTTATTMRPTTATTTTPAPTGTTSSSAKKTCVLDGKTLPYLFTDNADQKKKMCDLVKNNPSFKFYVYYKTDCTSWNAGTDLEKTKGQCEAPNEWSKTSTCALLDPYLDTTCGAKKPDDAASVCIADEKTLPHLFTGKNAEQKTAMCKFVKNFPDTYFVAYYKTDCTYWVIGVKPEDVEKDCKTNTQYSKTSSCVKLDPYLPTTCNVAKPKPCVTDGKTDLPRLFTFSNGEHRDKMCGIVKGRYHYVYYTNQCSKWVAHPDHDTAVQRCTDGGSKCCRLDPYQTGTCNLAQPAVNGTVRPMPSKCPHPDAIASASARSFSGGISADGGSEWLLPVLIVGGIVLLFLVVAGFMLHRFKTMKPRGSKVSARSTGALSSATESKMNSAKAQADKKITNRKTNASLNKRPDNDARPSARVAKVKSGANARV